MDARGGATGARSRRPDVFIKDFELMNARLSILRGLRNAVWPGGRQHGAEGGREGECLFSLCFHGEGQSKLGKSYVTLLSVAGVTCPLAASTSRVSQQQKPWERETRSASRETPR